MEDFYYEILEVKRNAKPAEIRKSYEKLVEMNHPNKHNDNLAKTVYVEELERAYEVLSDPVKRIHYDAKLKIKEEYGNNEDDEDSTSNSESNNGKKKQGIKPVKKYTRISFFTIIGIAIVILYYFIKVN